MFKYTEHHLSFMIYYALFSQHKSALTIQKECLLEDNRMTAYGKKPSWSEGLTALSFILTVQSVEAGKIEEKRKRKKYANSTEKAVCNFSWPAHTTSAQSQWWCSNLTDWAQAFVCLKPLTYFYSHCPSQGFYRVISELMQQVELLGKNELVAGIWDVCLIILFMF